MEALRSPLQAKRTSSFEPRTYRTFFRSSSAQREASYAAMAAVTFSLVACMAVVAVFFIDDH
jgi:hypothetical protein